MPEPITVLLPSEVKQALDEFVAKEGITPDDVVEQAIRRHLFLSRFRSLRQRMQGQSQGQLADQDVFDRVS